MKGGRVVEPVGQPFRGDTDRRPRRDPDRDAGALPGGLGDGVPVDRLGIVAGCGAHHRLDTLGGLGRGPAVDADLLDLRLARIDLHIKPVGPPRGCRWLVWHYKNKANLGNDWGRSHESILHFRKTRQFTFNVDEVTGAVIATPTTAEPTTLAPTTTLGY